MRKIRDSKRERQQSEGEEEEKGDEARGRQSMSVSSAFSSFKRSTGLWSREPGCLHFLPKGRLVAAAWLWASYLSSRASVNPSRKWGDRRLCEVPGPAQIGAAAAIAIKMEGGDTTDRSRRLRSE